MSTDSRALDIEVQPQPDGTTCGPTCLHAVYRYYGDTIALEDVIAGIPELPGGGTLAVNLACHALGRGYRATIFSYNLSLFDPTWFEPGAAPLTGRLEAQRRAKRDPKLALATDAYLEFLAGGGLLRWEDLTADLLGRYLLGGTPVLTGLSATYLYQCAREADDEYDDIAGSPSGHFVVLRGFDVTRGQVSLADPLHDNPAFGRTDYTVSVERLTAAILLGIVTYDANLLVIEKDG